MPGPTRQFVGLETVMVTEAFVGIASEAIAEGVPVIESGANVKVGVCVFGLSSGMSVGVVVNVTLGVMDGIEVCVMLCVKPATIVSAADVLIAFESGKPTLGKAQAKLVMIKIKKYLLCFLNIIFLFHALGFVSNFFGNTNFFLIYARAKCNSNK